MAYRVSEKRRKQLARMREAKERLRLNGPQPDYAEPLPELRKRITVTDFDFGEVTHTLELYRTDRVDCYLVKVDGKPWKARIGMSRILAGLRKSMPRLASSID